MPATTLAIQSFGRAEEYRRAALTVLSFYACTSQAIPQTKVLLFTDKPEYFSSVFEGIPVEFVRLTPEKIKTMRGKIDFLHRMKIALIEEAFSLSDGNILYADSDTFFTADPKPFLQQLAAGKCFMHEWEYKFEALEKWVLPAGKAFLDFLKLISTEKFKGADGRQIQVSREHSSWNAGVMMFHPSHARFIPDVYALTDQFYPASLNHASEQYAFSIILQEYTNLAPCDAVIYHYWRKVKKQIIDDFVGKRFTNEWMEKPLKEKLKQIRKWTAMLPHYMEHHPWLYRDNAIQALNEDKLKEGYSWALRSWLKKPLECSLLFKDVLYHTRRVIKSHS